VSPHGRYIATEVAISALINGALSLLAAWLVFGGRQSIEAAGPQGFAMDFLPQTFMVTLMSTLVPTWLTRRRVRSGQIGKLPQAASRLPQNVALRALALALASTALLGVGAMALAPVVLEGAVLLTGLLALKVAYGVVISVPVTGFALRAALAD
jgi:hypothetical protein